MFGIEPTPRLLFVFSAGESSSPAVNTAAPDGRVYNGISSRCGYGALLQWFRLLQPSFARGKPGIGATLAVLVTAVLAFLLVGCGLEGETTTAFAGHQALQNTCAYGNAIPDANRTATDQHACADGNSHTRTNRDSHACANGDAMAQ